MGWLANVIRPCKNTYHQMMSSVSKFHKGVIDLFRPDISGSVKMLRFKA